MVCQVRLSLPSLTVIERSGVEMNVQPGATVQCQPTLSNVRWNHASRVSANVANARFRELRSVGFLRMVLNNGVVMFEIETFEIKHEL